MFKSSGFNLN